MKTKLLMKHHIVFTGLLCSLLFVSCNKTSKSETETTVGNYKAPETIPLKFTEPEPFEWETITSDTLTTPVSYSLNIEELPSKPFELNKFKPLKTPMKEFDLDWESFPTEPLKFDSVPFTVTMAPIKKPKITKMKPPGIMDGTNTNLLQLSTNEGLEGNMITSFLENEDGSIWIGLVSITSPSNLSTLTLYDGENAFLYDYPAINEMIFDDQGRLWMATNGNGIYILDLKNDIEYTINISEVDVNFIDILQDHRGTIYLVAFKNGVYTIDAGIENLQKLTNKKSNLPLTLLEDSDKNIWLAFEDGIAAINEEKQDIKTIPGDTGFTLNLSTDIKEDASGAIWFCSFRTGEVASLSLKQKKARLLTKENGYNIIDGTRLEQDSKGNIWIAGNKEAFILSADRTRSKTIGTNSTMLTNRRGSILKKNDGSLWLGTLDKGVVIANNFTLNTEYFDASKGLMHDQIWEIEEDSRGNLWLGTGAGINIIDQKKNTIKSVTKEQLHFVGNGSVNYIKEISKDVYFLDIGAGFSIYDRQQHKITQYASNTNLVIEMLGFAALDEHTFCLYTPEGLYVYDIEQNSLKKITSKTDPDILKTQFGAEIVYDGNDILWIPTFNRGLAKVNLKNNTISYINKKQGLSDNNVGVASFSEEGELWVTTLSGIGILNLEQNTLTNLKEENGLIPSEMYDLIDRGDMMYGASVNGLIPIDKLTAKNTNKGYYAFNGGLGFKSNDYLSGSSKFLKNGQFWAGVVNSSNEFRLMVMDAAPKPDTTLSSVYITKMYIRDENPGFNNTESTDSLNNRVLSYANATNMKWDSIKHPYNIPTGLVLPFDQNSLSFSYASNDVFNREQLTYRFILDGEDEDWTYADSKTKTKNYYNLKPGEYTFKVASRSFNKQWSTPDELTFHISPPWWQTWWAYLIFALIAASILRVYILFRARKLTNENKLLEEKVKDRTNELEASIEDLKATQSQLIQSEKMASLGELTAGIAHEIQNPLNFVNNFSEVNVELIDEMQEELKAGNHEDVIEISNDIKENQKKIYHHGRRADSIVKGMLKHSRNTSGEKEPTNINAIADEYLRLAYHGLRAKDKSFNATLNTDLDESIGNINVAGQDMGRVILNLITNALHAISPNALEGTDKKPTIWVSTKNSGDTVEIKIKDNGSGIPKKIIDKIFQPFFTTKASGQGTGLGLSMSYDIVKSHGGELKVESKEGEGTTFTIIIPK
ncbi:ATP-binding protein [Aureibaculum conchae]|uniref:ATP-binding protein n=1 Tax=Aureibaculum sp. 2308TA14-22 TaxID=3108392 RepID=UPI00339AF034